MSVETDQKSEESPQLMNVAREFTDLLNRYAYSLLKNEARAKDCVQDTFLKLAKQARPPATEYLRPWLFRVCRNCCFDLMKKEGRMNSMENEILEQEPDPQKNPDQLAEANDRSAVLLKVTETLPNAQQEALRLRFQAGLSYREIAETTNKSVSVVGVLIHDGLIAMRKKLGNTELAPDARS